MRHWLPRSKSAAKPFVSALTPLVFVLASHSVICEPFTPPFPDTVIATWPATERAATEANTLDGPNSSRTPQELLQQANRYLIKASLPGQAGLYGFAEATLKPLVNKQTVDTEVLLAWARLQQHQHAFSAALAALDEVLQQDPSNISGNLLAARIYLIQQNYDGARKACMRLLGSADLFTTSACALEVASYNGELEASYKQLAQLVDRQGLPDDERAPWATQMLADMATRLGKSKAAAQWLDQQLTGADVSYLAQWADAQLAIDAPKRVLAHLQPIVEAAPAMDDALLLRLAKAEKTLGGSHWQPLLAERVKLREMRQDTQHASELADYYLHIDPKPEKALYWARLNWQSAREPADEQLLREAEKMTRDGKSRAVTRPITVPSEDS